VDILPVNPLDRYIPLSLDTATAATASESVIEGVKLAVEGNVGVCFAADPALRSVETATEIPLEQLGIPSTTADELAKKFVLEYNRAKTIRYTI